MDNYSYSSYADSRDSSPHSRDIDCENAAWDEPPSNLNGHNYKVKFMCSYGGKIQPRAHDNQLTYTGGESKILAVDHNINFSALSSRLSTLCDVSVCFKYQLPGEDLDALISVTNDEDLGHMMLEYDRLYRVSKPARLRLFLFPLNPPAPTSFVSRDPKSKREWFVDALNSVQIQPLESSSPSAVALGSNSNPDFLFGFDKGYAPVPASNLMDSTAEHPVSNTTMKDVSAGSNCGSEERHVVGEPVVSLSEFHRQIQDLQRLQIAVNERSSDETNSRTSTGDYYTQYTENIAPSPVPLPLPLGVPAAYLPDRHMISSGYPVAAAANAPDTDKSMYLISTPGGVYHPQRLKPVTGPVGQPYYGMNAYREAQVHSSVPPQASLQQPNVGVYTTEGIQMVQPKVGMADTGFAQVAYDNTGRQVYFTTVPPYQTIGPVAVDGRQSGSNFNQEGNVGNPSKSSGL